MSSSVIRKLYALLPADERWKALLLLGAMFGVGLWQVLALASVVPFIGLVANPNLVHSNPWMHRVFGRVGIEDTRQALFAMGATVVAFFALGNAVAALTSWFSYRFIWHVQQKIAQRMLEGYLAQPYTFFLDHNGTTLGETLLGEVRQVIANVFVPTLEVISKGLSTTFVIVLLILMDPWLTAIVAFGLGTAYGLVYWLARSSQKRLGARQVEANITMWRIVSEAFGGIKDVKVLGRERDFVDRFRGPSLRYATASASNDSVRQLPSYAMETIATGGMLAVLLYLLRVRDSLADVLPVVALYSVAGNRLMPAFHQIFSGLSQIRFNTAVLDRLYGDVIALPSPTLLPPSRRTRVIAPAGSEIRFQDVSFVYPQASRQAVKHINVVIAPNTAVGLVGSTGSGKTTLVDLILGLLMPTTGDLLIDGQRLDSSSAANWRSRVGYVPQHIFLSDDTVARNIAFGCPDGDVDQAAVERAATAASLHGFVTRLANGYDTMVGERGVRLSGGERQRIGIARALYHQPDVLVFDEATSALDTVTEEAVMSATRELSADRTVILIAHRLSTVRHCHNIILLDAGAVVAQGTYDELVATNPSFRAMAGLRGE
jgi:ABC-type multidrug transport system fused ATPase/permease subunit